MKDVKVVIERHANPKNKVPNNVTDLIKAQNIKVYEVLDVDTLNDSGSLEGVNYKDVTNIFKPTISEDGEEITFDFKDTNKTYILSVEGENNRPFNEGDRLEGRATVKSPDHEKPWYYDFIYTKTEPTKNDEIGEKINPPEIEKIKDQSPVEVGTPIAEIGIKDKNNDRGPLTHEVTGLPDGVTFDPETNTIKGTPTKSGEYPVTVTTTDKDGNKTETKFNLPVKDTTPPEVEEIPDQEAVEAGSPIKEIGINGKDNGGGPLTHEVTGLPDGVTFDPNTNTIKGTPTKPGNYEVTVTTTDETGNEAKTKFNISVKESESPEDNGGLEFNQKGERLVSPENDHTIDNRDKETSVNDKDRNFKSKSGSMKNSKSTLPETGNESAPTTLVGMLFAAIGSLFLFRRKRQKRD
ncbi:TPA: putative Ig domain-containing protein [Staphylococcus aureus]|nr:putative Ig domain-containing protein [Staphylococcus aureus]